MRTRGGRGSKIPKISRTSYMEATLQLCAGLCNFGQNCELHICSHVDPPDCKPISQWLHSVGRHRSWLQISSPARICMHGSLGTGAAAAASSFRASQLAFFFPTSERCGVAAPPPGEKESGELPLGMRDKDEDNDGVEKMLRRSLGKREREGHTNLPLQKLNSSAMEGAAKSTF